MASRRGPHGIPVVPLLPHRCRLSLQGCSGFSSTESSGLSLPGHGASGSVQLHRSEREEIEDFLLEEEKFLLACSSCSSESPRGYQAWLSERQRCWVCRAVLGLDPVRGNSPKFREFQNAARAVLWRREGGRGGSAAELSHEQSSLPLPPRPERLLRLTGSCRGGQSPSFPICSRENRKCGEYKVHLHHHGAFAFPCNQMLKLELIFHANGRELMYSAPINLTQALSLTCVYPRYRICCAQLLQGKC